MGCWNETCMLTHLPIFEDEPTVCFLIARRPGDKDTCFCDDVFTPISLPVSGKYDDYGRLYDTTPTPTFFAVLTKADLAIRKNEDDIITFTPIKSVENYEGDGLTDLLDIARQGSLYLRDTEAVSGYSRVYLAFIKKPFFDDAVKVIKGELPDDFIEDGWFAYRLAAPLKVSLKEKTIGAADLRELAELNTFMSRCRLSWHPTCGSGSQNGINGSYHMKFYQDMVEHAKSLVEDIW